jgi:hypothetical protein
MSKLLRVLIVAGIVLTSFSLAYGIGAWLAHVI